MKPFKIAEIYRRKLDSVKNATGKSNHSEFQISTCKMCVSPRKRLERDTKKREVIEGSSGKKQEMEVERLE